MINTGKIVLTPIKKSIVDQTAGSLTRNVPASKLGKSWKQIMFETKRITAKKIAQEGL